MPFWHCLTWTWTSCVWVVLNDKHVHRSDCSCDLAVINTHRTSHNKLYPSTHTATHRMTTHTHTHTHTNIYTLIKTGQGSFDILSNEFFCCHGELCPLFVMTYEAGWLHLSTFNIFLRKMSNLLKIRGHHLFHSSHFQWIKASIKTALLH